MYEIKDPLSSRMKDWLAANVVCRFKGHKPTNKMYGQGPCRRCSS